MTNAKNTTNLQDLMLNQIRNEHIPVSYTHLFSGLRFLPPPPGYDIIPLIKGGIHAMGFDDAMRALLGEAYPAYEAVSYTHLGRGVN